MKRRAFLFGLVTSGCASQSLPTSPNRPSHYDVTKLYDPWGYVQPPECCRDLSWLNVPVRRVAPSDRLLQAPDKTWRQAATWFDRGRPDFVAVSTAVPFVDYRMVLHHEECHWLKGDWHR